MSRDIVSFTLIARYQNCNIWFTFEQKKKKTKMRNLVHKIVNKNRYLLKKFIIADDTVLTIHFKNFVNFFILDNPRMRFRVNNFLFAAMHPLKNTPADKNGTE